VHCLGDAPIRRSGPPRHQTGVTKRPASQSLSPPEQRLPATRRSWLDVHRGRPCSVRRIGGPHDRGHTTDPAAAPGWWLLRQRPLPDSVFSAVLVEQLTSRRFSTDESVAIHPRFRRRIARVSHGLGSPSRSSCFRGRPLSCRAEAWCRSGRSSRRRQAVGSLASASPTQRVVLARAAVSLPGFPAPPRPSAEAVTADDALSAKSVRMLES
jgi:hypothetical protein